MKHAVSITSPGTTYRQNQWWLGLLLLLVLVALQSRILPFEPLAKQLFSINESNVLEQQLLIDPVDNDNPSFNLILSNAASLALQSSGFEVTYADQPRPSSLRWRIPSTRAPPAFS